jgi:hypothetical protein
MYLIEVKALFEGEDSLRLAEMGITSTPDETEGLTIFDLDAITSFYPVKGKEQIGICFGEGYSFVACVSYEKLKEVIEQRQGKIMSLI